jgi:hypothetical protein
MKPDHGMDDDGADALSDLDEEILAGVRQLWETVDPVPAGLVEQIQFAIDLDAIDVEVSRLTELRELAAARTDELARLVTFQSDSLSIMIAIDPRPDGTARIDGWLTPAARHEIELRSPAKPPTLTRPARPACSLNTESDETGRFALDAVPTGIVQLVVHVAGNSRRVITPTMEI